MRGDLTGLEFALTWCVVAFALVGVYCQNYALQLADMGEIPDVRGAFLGGDLPFETAKQWYTDLRTHYRRAASKLSMAANLVLLISTVCAVALAWLSRWAIGIPVLVLLAIVFVHTLVFWYRRKNEITKREDNLEMRREQFNASYTEGAAKTMGTTSEKAAIKPIPPFKRVRL